MELKCCRYHVLGSMVESLNPIAQVIKTVVTNVSSTSSQSFLDDAWSILTWKDTRYVNLATILFIWKIMSYFTQMPWYFSFKILHVVSNVNRQTLFYVQGLTLLYKLHIFHLRYRTWFQTKIGNIVLWCLESHG